nr:PREDICTED: Kv channel-interacting protein 4 [Megachile rotundata]
MASSMFRSPTCTAKLVAVFVEHHECFGMKNITVAPGVTNPPGSGGAQQNTEGHTARESVNFGDLLSENNILKINLNTLSLKRETTWLHLRKGSGTTWGRGSRGRGRDRGGGANLIGSGVAPANYSSGLQGVAPELREVVNILGERNQVGTLTGVGPPPDALDNDSQGDEEEGTSTKRPPRPLYRRLINYIRQAWTGVKFALDSEYEEEQTPRYRPDSLASLCRATRFTEAELKRIYRGFKAECPTGVVREETFKCIYSQFFPQGANTSQYAHYVFNTLDQDHSGILSFEDFVTGLSILSRGSIDEKLRWTFSLYDINGDGCITREEMTDIVTAVYELMGKFADPNLDHAGVREKVDRMFQKMDGNKDGVVTLSEFLEACQADPDISTSMAALDTAF